MIRRATAIVFAVLTLLIGAGAAWVAASVPRDIRAETLLKDARARLQDGKKDEARQTLHEIVKSYPRTDAAAAASYALFRLVEQERKELAARIEELEKDRESQVAAIQSERKAREDERAGREADLARIEELEKKLAESAKSSIKVSTAPKKKR
ncbi:MAG TPA: hypothetical protein VM557_03195 [Thermoanaerobaculia bacterium]|nr:hypothetical protein [Thermoanaerobaculia bacterium]